MSIRRNISARRLTMLVARHSVERVRPGSRVVLTLGISLLTLIGLSPGDARAQFAVFDASAFGEAIKEAANQATQISHQVAQIQNQVTALRKLTHPTWRNLTGTFSGLNGDFGSTNGIVYGSGNPTGTLSSVFPGGRPSVQYLPERAAQVSRALGTAAAVLSAAQHQAQTFVAGLRQLSDMNAQLGSIHGHEEALELANSIALFQAGENLLSRQATEAANNLAAVRLAQETTDSAQPEANAHAWYAQLAVDAPRRALMSFRPGA
jgi:P-type conjugative transfer protein TrbJ